MSTRRKKSYVRRTKKPTRFYKGGSRIYKKRGTYRKFKSFKMLPRSKILMPKQFYTKLVYYYHENNTIVGGVDTYQWRGNSVYDPDYEAGGGQPAGFDQLSALYSQYCVFAAKLEMTVQSLDTVPTFIGLHARYSDTTVPTTNEKFIENPECRYMWVAPQGSPGDKKTIKYFRTAKKMFNCKNIRDEQNYSSAITTNPANQWFFVVRMANTDAGNMAIITDTRIVYYVVFYDRNVLVDA